MNYTGTTSAGENYNIVWNGQASTTSNYTPTPTVTTISTSNSTSASPTPTPTVPEFPIWIILPLFAVIMLLSTVFIRKRILTKFY